MAAGEGRVLWEPSEELLRDSKMARYMESRGFSDYEELWRWSVDDLEGFWRSIWELYEVGPAPERVLGRSEMPGAEWFPGATLNYAEHVFRGARAGETAVLHATESSPLAELTWDELADGVARCAAGLRRLGVGSGDRVVAYMPNVAETLIAFLATASIGAIWSSCAPEFGTPTVVDRFSQIEPKVMIATEGYRYNGRDFDRRDRVREIEAALPTLEHTVSVPSGWDELLSEPAELSFEPVPFDHPLWVLFSSGTTGLPKAIVQGHGGILLEHLKKLNLHSDLSAGDRFFWYTTTGWMMWNFLVGGLLAGAAIVLYDGHPDPERMWQFAADAGVTCFGTSAGFIGACMKAGVEPPPLPALRSVGSTGSPLPVEGFEWVYDKLGDVWLFSTSGGTDLCTAFVGACPLLPVRAGELQARALGASVEAWDEDGNGTGRRGRRARHHAADAVDAALLLERPRRRALPRELLRRLPGRLAPRRLDQDHPARLGRDLRPLRLDDQPRRSAHGHQRAVLGDRGRGRRCRTAWSWTSTTASCCSWSPPRTWTTSWSRRSAGACASTARRATRPMRSTASTRSRARSRTRSSRCRSSGSCRAATRRRSQAATRSPTRPRSTGSPSACPS